MTKCFHPTTDLAVDDSNEIIDEDDNFIYIGCHIFCRQCMKQFEIETCKINKQKLLSR